MKWLFLLLIIPCVANAQFTTDPQWERPQRHYFKLGGGYVFPEKQSSGPMGAFSVGWRAKRLLMAGLGAEVLRMPGYDKYVIPAGLDINFFDFDMKYSPVLHAGVAYPFEGIKDINSKLYYTGGFGFSYMGESRKGVMLIGNYSRLEYEQVLIGGPAVKESQAIYSVSLHVIL
ncbi:MAG: hypothetical protein EOO02_11865 [Chitinophagaceae bacterium]|nr:MAG: hypothetical protein EOO02_11865 [Chitinophagaceae bacterium]